MNRKNIPLHILDSYAKILTTNQTKKLYEAKCNKTYKRKLLKEADLELKYHFFIPKSVLIDTDNDINDVLRYLQYGEVSNGDEKLNDFYYTIDNHQGYWIECAFHDTFEKILGRVANLGLSNELEKYVEPKEYVRFLYPEGSDVEIY